MTTNLAEIDWIPVLGQPRQIVAGALNPANPGGTKYLRFSLAGATNVTAEQSYRLGPVAEAALTSNENVMRFWTRPVSGSNQNFRSFVRIRRDVGPSPVRGLTFNIDFSTGTAAFSAHILAPAVTPLTFSVPSLVVAYGTPLGFEVYLVDTGNPGESRIVIRYSTDGTTWTEILDQTGMYNFEGLIGAFLFGTSTPNLVGTAAAGSAVAFDDIELDIESIPVAPPPSFLPTDLGTKLQGWWDVSDVANRIDDGVRISSLADKSLTTNAATEGTYTARPFLVPAGQNGLDTLLLDYVGNVSQRLISIAPSFTHWSGSTDLHMFAAFDPQIDGAGVGGPQFAWFLDTVAGVGGELNMAMTKPTTPRIFVDNDGLYHPAPQQYTAFTGSLSKWSIIRLSWFSDGTIEASRNGVVFATGSSVGRPVTINPLQQGVVLLGSGFLGPWPVNYPGAELGELFIVNQPMTAQEITDAETYLITKWGFDP